MDDRFRLLRTLKGPHRVAHDRVLLRFIKGRARRVAKRKINECRTWRSSRLKDVQGTAEAKGRNSGIFEVARDQTHGLMAHRSHGYEKGRIDILRPIGIK